VFSLAGKKALIVGIANEDSIAFGCAKAFRAQGDRAYRHVPRRESRALRTSGRRKARRRHYLAARRAA
jgi:enoyl-[acyl-carrier-protein] reductase (NADH)